MKIFHLPDLGEGLHEAEIRKWHVQAGDTVKTDQIILEVETAKAVVEIPSPYSGKIEKLHGKPGDLMEVDQPLVEFESDEETTATPPTKDAGTVVGEIKESSTLLEESATGIAHATPTGQFSKSIKATPHIRSLAKSLELDLTQITGSGPNATITVKDIKGAITEQARDTSSSATKHSALPIEHALDKGQGKHTSSSQKPLSLRKPSSPQKSSSLQKPSSPPQKPSSPQKRGAKNTPNLTPLRGVRRAMAINMSQSHTEVVPVTLMDQADIHHWFKKEDLTLRLIQALIKACQTEKSLNTHYHSDSMSLQHFEEINIGIAVDTPKGLYVPVLKDAAQQTPDTLRHTINTFKEKAKAQHFTQSDLENATITLSNFGVFVGRYATPIVIPPCVAIVGVGVAHDNVVAEKNKPTVHRTLPLSLTFDHRAVTGGEAARFLKALIEALEGK